MLLLQVFRFLSPWFIVISGSEIQMRHAAWAAAGAGGDGAFIVSPEIASALLTSKVNTYLLYLHSTVVQKRWSQLVRGK